MIVFDTTLALLLFVPDAPAASYDGEPIDRARDRIDELVRSLSKSDTKIALPAPALSEALVTAGGQASDYVEFINRQAVFKVEPFDERAAIELALMTRKALDKGPKGKFGGIDKNWQHIKLDRQIVAIAKVCGARVIYSDDGGVRKFAVEAGLNVASLSELPLPPEPEPIRQGSLLDFANRPRMIDVGE